MVWLILGIFLWIFIHAMKRVFPGLRESIANAFGEGGSKGMIALGLLLSLVLMIIGYRSAEFTPIYNALSFGGHLNNLLMLVAVLMLGMGSSKGRLRSFMRHPMLGGVVVWGLAHLLVNGDLASLVLFGSMILWALSEMYLINRAEGAWVRPEPGPIQGDIRLAIITLIVFSVIAGIHIALGKNPFLGSY